MSNKDIILRDYSLASNEEIKDLANNKDLITPFIPNSVSEVSKVGKVVSYGLSQSSYDIRLGNEFKRLDRNKVQQYEIPITGCVYLDPKEELDNEIVSRAVIADNKPFILYPNEFVLAHTVETFNMPNNLTGFLYCKSTYARLGLNMAPTVLKPRWKGILTLELYNQSRFPIKLYVNEGIGTIYFLYNAITNDEYNGKYQNQVGTTTHIP